jgi:4-phosphopantoate--beta-alanine ligase
MAMGKTVLVIDLNPLSRTAQMASVTMVDELSRVVENMNKLLAADELPKLSHQYNNELSLQDSLNHIKDFLTGNN